MGIVKQSVFSAMFLTVMSGAMQAQSVSVSGNTTGCFNLPCTATSGGNASNGTKFTGTTFDWAAIANTPQTVDLGTIILTGKQSGTFDTDFKLVTAFTSPTTNPSSGTVTADVAGSFKYSPDQVFVDFTNSPTQYAFDGGTIFLTVNDLTFYNPGSQTVTGTLLYVPTTTTTPEPASLALIGTGLVGLVPIFRRKRK